MPIDYRKLKGKIIEVFGKQSDFAKSMEWSERTMSLKINGKVSWKQSEILRAVELLGLKEEDILEFFYT